MGFCKRARRAALVVFSLLATVGSMAFAQVAHFVDREPSHWEPCTPKSLTEQINQAAEQYKAFAPIPRVAFIDVAYPRDDEEATAVAGYAVVLVTSISQDKTELPLRRVYVIADGRSLDLECLVAVESTIPKKDKKIARTFGQNRSDGLYLMPICVSTKNGVLLVDFAKNRSGFKIYEFQGSGPRDLGAWEEWPAPESRPSAQALEDFIRREFPCFIAK